jgi:hypothetical protein
MNLDLEALKYVGLVYLTTPFYLRKHTAYTDEVIISDQFFAKY